MQNIVATPILSLGFRSISDPAGNNQESYEIIYRLADGSEIHSALTAQVHAGQKIRFYHSNPSPSATAGDYFELDGNGRVLIQEA